MASKHLNTGSCAWCASPGVYKVQVQCEDGKIHYPRHGNADYSGPYTKHIFACGIICARNSIASVVYVTSQPEVPSDYAWLAEPEVSSWSAVARDSGDDSDKTVEYDYTIAASVKRYRDLITRPEPETTTHR